jgi:hypothetical protein
MFDTKKYRKMLVAASDAFKKEVLSYGPDPIMSISISMLDALILKIDSGVFEHKDLELQFGGRAQVDALIRHELCALFNDAHLYWKNKGEIDMRPKI